MSMRQTTLLSSDRNSVDPTRNNTISGKKRPPACIEILDNDDNDNHAITTTIAQQEQVVEETLGPMPYSVFREMWKQVEQDDGWETADFEATHAFKKANNETDCNDTTSQKKAQYGRLSFQGTRVLFQEIVPLKWFHTFLDIGHGVGNAVLQAAYTVGCQSLGIELVNLRAERADVYAEKCHEYNTLIHQKRDGKVSR